MSGFLKTVFLLLTLGMGMATAQQYTVNGYVKDKNTGETLIGVSLFVQEIKKGTTTNNYGFYSLSLAKGSYNVLVSYIGYTTRVLQVVLDQNRVLDVSLEPVVIETKEVEITGEKADRNIQSSEMSITQLPIEQIKALPAFMGEVDVLKTIQLLPGVQSAGEGTAGFYVRGGGPDQNLVLLDEAVVYNASHMFGFFSIFNSDAINNVTLIKGGMPANYGGRLASVLDISMKEGNSHKLHGEGGIGVISSRFTLEGPLKKEKSSFIVSGRRTYIDLLLKPYIDKDEKIRGSGYYFYDLTTKVNYTLSRRDRIFLSAYLGRDILSYNNNISRFNVHTPWGNVTATARWNHLFREKMFANTSLIFSDYQFSTDISQRNFSLKLFSGIRDWNLKSDFSYFPNVFHSIRFGANYIYHTFTPSSVSAKAGNVELKPKEIKRQYANEMAVYFSDDYDITDRLRINGGLRYSAFQHVGPYERYVKDFRDQITDTVYYRSMENIRLYHGAEPRVTMRYTLNPRSSVKASYTYNYQYLHLASFAAITLPTDIWVPSSLLVKPQTGNLYVLGYFRNFKKNTYETSLELYYKTMDNLVDYKDGLTPQNNVNDNIENNLTFGSGESYGAELFAKRNYGKWNGWIGYTLSYTTRQFPDLNGGKEFFAMYDRRHDVSAVLSYQLSKKWSFSWIFVYATGNTYTPAIGVYYINGRPQYEYPDRNTFRMEPYHRMDISVTYTGKKTEKFESSWNFSVYNLYNRMNPYFIYTEQTGSTDNNNLKLQVKQVSLFPILPSLTWNFKF
jgi:hypothetical protein